MRQRWRTALSDATLFILAVIMGLWCFWLFDPRMPLHENAAEIIEAPRTKEGVPAYYYGEQMIVQRFVCISQPPLVVRRNFVDHLVYQLPLTTWFGSTTGCMNRRIGVLIPSGLPPGRYNYESEVTFDLNPLKRLSVPLQPLPLQVLGPPLVNRLGDGRRRTIP